MVRKDRVFQNVDPNEWGSSPESSTPVSPVLALVGFVGLCVLVGAADAGMAAGTARAWYFSLTRPLGTPPIWAFGLVWAVLSVMIGVAGWLVWTQTGATQSLRLWGWQLAANALWTPALLGFHSPMLALAVSVVLLALIGLTIHAFMAIRPLSAWLMAPYFAWTAYATYLTAGFWWLNPGLS